MALQGTIDAFALTDVLQLLSSSAKSGRLRLDGDRGRAELWIDGGVVVGGAPAAADAAELLVTLLRFEDASFEFDLADGSPPVVVPRVPLHECLETAAGLLEDWRRIEKIVPTADHVIRPVAELSDPVVTLDAADWSLLVAVGDGRSVGEVRERLGWGEHAAASAVAGMVGRGLLEVGAPASDDVTYLTDSVEPADDALSGDAGFVPFDAADSFLSTQDAPTDHPERTDGTDAEEPVRRWHDDDPEPFAAAQTLVSFDRRAEPPVSTPEVEDNASEVLRQMASLSPKAAEAIAAALNTPAGPVAGDGNRTGEDGPGGFGGSL